MGPDVYSLHFPSYVKHDVHQRRPSILLIVARIICLEHKDDSKISLNSWFIIHKRSSNFVNVLLCTFLCQFAKKYLAILLLIHWNPNTPKIPPSFAYDLSKYLSFT